MAGDGQSGEKPPWRPLARIEMSAGARNKFRVYRETGEIRHSRVIPERKPGPCPANYGYVIDHFGFEDQKEIDAFVFTEVPLPPGSVVQITPLAMFIALDEREAKVEASDDERTKDVKPIEDVKIVAVAETDKLWGRFTSWSDVKAKHPDLQKELVTYIRHYKGYEVQVKVHEEMNHKLWLAARPSEFTPEVGQRRAPDVKPVSDTPSPNPVDEEERP